jgi:hypothetical protein
MVQLAVTSGLTHYEPSVVSKELEGVTNFHQYTPTVVWAAISWKGRTPLTPSQGYLS